MIFAGQAERVQLGERYYHHHRSIQSFREAADSRCQLCAQLWTKFEARFSEHNTLLPHCGLKILFVIFAIPTAAGELVDDLQFDFYARSSVTTSADHFPRLPSPPTQLFENELYEEIFFVPFSLLRSRSQEDTRSLSDIGTRSNSSGSLGLINRWVTECVTNHELCRGRSRRNEHPPPSRLIDVGSQGQERVHLRMIGNTWNFTDEYITLSHRWGSVHRLTLQNDTIDELIAGIALERLPRSFSDAISITRRLGVRYLWINSLCIFQDSVDDWMQEGANMGNIYRFGFLNIAATSATDSNGGLFFDRDPHLVQPVRISMRWPLYQDQEPSLLAQDFDCVPQELWGAVEGATLNTRAWVMQERILSLRILHCHEDQLFWECKTKRACEKLPDGFRDSISQRYDRLITLIDRIQDASEIRFWPDGRVERATLNTSPDHHMETEIYCAWFETIEEYSACDLTVEGDKLIAISAIAKVLQWGLFDRYLAGIFQGQLAVGLLWRAVGQRRSQPTRYGPFNSDIPWLAPSWS